MASAPARDLLDLPTYQGQRAATFRFDLVDGRTRVRRGQLRPLRSSPATLSHDTTSTISRRVNGLVLGPDDAARINPLTDRVLITMLLPGAPTYPLGRYLVADAIDLPATGGNTRPLTLFDDMLIVDQDLEAGFDAGGQLVDQAVRRLIDGLPLDDPVIDATEQTSVNAWSPGTSRAAALIDLATVGGYLKPWFDHAGRLRMLRAFDPVDRTPTIDLDANRRVLRNSISRTCDLIAAPNRFVVVSNDPAADTAPIIGTWDVPSSAPHSIAQRGFVVPKVIEAQLPSQRHATVYARTLGLQQTVYETVELSTPPDPRHDGYDVVRFDAELWLEVGWELPLTPGGEMRHKLRRAYPTTHGDL